MLVRSRISMPPSKRSRSKWVRRSPWKPAYTIAATIAPMIPPHRAAATSTPPPRLGSPPRGSVPERRGKPGAAGGSGAAAGGGGLVGLGDLGGHHRPGVAARRGAGGLPHRRPPGGVVEQAGQGGGQRLRVPCRHQ